MIYWTPDAGQWTPFTVSGWQTILFKAQSNDMEYGLYANTDSSRPRGYIYRTGEDSVSGTSALAANTWSHLALTYDGTKPMRLAGLVDLKEQKKYVRRIRLPNGTNHSFSTMADSCASVAYGID